jgi:hypothetical protein
MSSVKRISGNYTISSIGTTDNVSISTNTLTVAGNLVVTGSMTTIQSNNIATFDPTITLNANIGSNSAPFAGNSGIEVNRGSQPSTALYWNETVQAWQLVGNVNNPSTYANIGTTLTASGVVSPGTVSRLAYYAISGSTVEDTGANLTWNGSSTLTVTGNVDTTNANISTTLTLAGVALTANSSGQGGTGVFAGDTSASAELVSKRKARKFAIIFG